MFKLLLIVALFGFLFYILYTRFVKPNFRTSNNSVVRSNGYYLLTVTNSVISMTIKKTITAVGIGIILLAITLLLAIKIKILLFLLPISVYLIGHLFLLSNHIKHSKNQQIWFDPLSNNVVLEQLNEPNLQFNLSRDLVKVKEIKSVQNTNGLQFGYYILYIKNHQIYLPFLLKENLSNKSFFDQFTEIEKTEKQTKLFPII